MFTLRLREEVLVPSPITTALVVVSVIFPLISAASIYLRFHVRRKSHRQYGWDDTWLIIAWVSTLAIAILIWVCSGISGVNYYKVDKARGEFISSLLILTSSIIIQLPLAAVKISILLFYQRVFPTAVFKFCNWIAIIIVSIWAILFFFLTLFQKRYYSDLLNGTGKWLLDSSSVGLAQVSSSIALDILVLTFPLPVIYRLNMARSRKIAVALMFWLGAFCVVTAILRLFYLNKSIREISKDHDHLYLQSNIFIWKMIEPNVSILAANLPLYGPLLKGGRGPESIIRSVRSVLSIGSSAPKGSRDRTGKQDNGAEDESLVSAGHQHWPGRGQQDVQCVGGKNGDEIEMASLDPPDRIEVTRGVTVVTE
ncbi:hypothetical protein F4801DRAFT_553894 [Xylaria longipes]|nr:hypothetical protein F4801DRAFT_553894 [Xylaria longipes]